MKRAPNIVSIVTILAAAFGIWSIYTPPVSGADPARPTAFEGFSLDQPRIIDFSVNAESQPDPKVEELTPREELDRQRKHFDQLRDWSLLTVIAATGLQAQDLSQSLYDLPALRHENLRRVANFEYGETRSRVIGDGDVIALIPVSSPEQRTDHLGHIADEQRKSLGRIPEKFYIFELELHPEQDYGRITRRQALDGKELYSEQYGYIERPIRNLDDFAQFVAKIDDITFARRNDSSLILGGRKLSARSYKNIRVEDVAALWRSELGLTGFGSSGFSLDPKIDLVRVTKSFDTKIAPLLSTLAAIRQADIEKLRVVLSEIEKARASVNQENRDTFLRVSQAVFLEALANLCQGGADAKECLVAVTTILSEYRFQAATYFGDLQGTEVGMVLFYTDLLMKLWALDYLESTPRRIVGFPIQTEMRTSAIYRKELEDLPATRFWLSSLDRGFQVAEDGQSLLFARNATSIFAHPQDLLLGKDRPDASEPNVFDRAFINWWNDHYEEIARYEPEYERLNEIMKWSQVVGWINSAKKGNLLSFLEPVPITRINIFTTWIRQQPELTFQNWDKVKFYEPGYGGSTTEAMEILRSKEFPFFGQPLSWSGGVSLAGRATFVERAALSQRITAVARRANLDYRLSDLVTGRLRTLEATEYTFRSFADEAAETLARARPNARLSGDVGELANVEFQRVISRTSDGLLMRTRAVGKDFGDLSISRTARGYKVGWQGRDIDLGQSLARRLSISQQPEELLLREPNLENVIKLPGDRAYLVKTRGTDSWIKIAAEEGDDIALAKGYQYRVAGLSDKAKTMDVAWLDDAAVQNELGGEGYLIISGEKGSASAVRMSLSPQGPATATREITLTDGNFSLRAKISRETDTIYVRWKELPPSVRYNPSRIPEMIQSGRLEANQSYLRFARDLETRSYSEAARDLARDPAGFRARLDEHLVVELKRNREFLVKQQFELAKRQIEDLILVHGDLPELTLRKAVLELSVNKVDRAAATLQTSARGSLRNAEAFYEEINHRLANQAVSAGERTNLGNLARLADSYGSELGRIGEVIPEAHGAKLTLQFRVGELPKGGVGKLEDLTRSDAIVYFQDSPGLNNIDVPASAMNNSLRQLISANRVSIREVGLTDLSHFRPAVIYETQTQTALRLSSKDNLATRAFNYYHPISSITNAARNNDDDKDKEKRVYIVLENKAPVARP